MQKTKKMLSQDEYDELLLLKVENSPNTTESNYNLSFDPLDNFHANFVSIFQNMTIKKDLLQ